MKNFFETAPRRADEDIVEGKFIMDHNSWYSFLFHNNLMVLARTMYTLYCKLYCITSNISGYQESESLPNPPSPVQTDSETDIETY